ncbi:MAG: metallophosphoesterase [Desulfuromonadaceae bacterium]|nr:metallophosphoesterase [Desulfuromonadaceae bacterium]
MKILVISDTHGNVNGAFAAHTRSEPVDAIVHLGDGSSDADILREALDIPVISVAGNCDPGSTSPRECVWECEGKKLLLTHGDAYQVKSGLVRLQQRVLELGIDGALFGHTHQRICEKFSGILLINPGTLAAYGMSRSYAVLSITLEEGLTCRHFDLE